MAFTTQDLATITFAIASGYKRMRLNGREVEYHSIAQMKLAKAEIEEDLNRQAAIDDTTKRRPRVYRARTSRGY